MGGAGPMRGGRSHSTKVGTPSTEVACVSSLIPLI